jgi:hypothetical protein
MRGDHIYENVDQKRDRKCQATKDADIAPEENQCGDVIQHIAGQKTYTGSMISKWMEQKPKYGMILTSPIVNQGNEGSRIKSAQLGVELESSRP